MFRKRRQKFSHPSDKCVYQVLVLNGILELLKSSRHAERKGLAFSHRVLFLSVAK